MSTKTNDATEKSTEKPLTPEYVGKLSPEEITALKTQHDRIREIVVKCKDGSFSVCYCKYPDRNTIALAMMKRNQSKILETGESILDNCWVAGDTRPKNEESIRIAASMECYELLDFLQASSSEV